MEKEEKLLPRSNFSSFQHFFIYIFLTLGVKLRIHLLTVVGQFIVFLTLSTLKCRGTDISKCFSESLEIRDNESRLYFLLPLPARVSQNILTPTFCSDSGWATGSTFIFYFCFAAFCYTTN